MIPSSLRGGAFEVAVSLLLLVGCSFHFPAVHVESHATVSTYTKSKLPLDRQRRRALEGIPTEPSPRIINGVEVEPFRFSYMVVLNEKHVLKCGGSVGNLARSMVSKSVQFHCCETE
jgi:hypothetical protein